MNDKKIIVIFAISLLVISALSFGAGCIFGYRYSVRQDRRADNEFREQLADKQKQIDRLEAELINIGDVVRNVNTDISRTVDGISEQIDFAIQQGGDIRAAFSEIRKAVKELENRERYYRELAYRLPDMEHNTSE